MSRDKPVAPSDKLKRLYHQLTRHYFGEPGEMFVFDEPSQPWHLPVIHVLVWRADEHCDVTTFNTLGMSDRHMIGADYFSELHLEFRGVISETEQVSVARYLADIAEYPFMHDRKLDWWERLANPGKIPLFPECTQILFHPALVEGALDVIDDDEGPVKLLYVVPITPTENHILREHGKDAFNDYVAENEIDILSNR